MLRNIVGTFAALFKRTSTAAPTLADAQHYHQDGLLAQAQTIYENILRTTPDHFDALQLLGLLKHQQGDHLAAITLLKKAATINNYFYPVHINLAAAYRHTGNLVDALHCYENALRLEPNDASTLANQASALYELGDYEKTLSALDKLLTLAPEHGDALLSYGNCLFHLCRFEEAIVYFESALRINPHCATAHLNQSLCRLTLGDFVNGLVHYEWRHKNDQGQYQCEIAAPLWLGAESLAGKRIFLWAEQGLGDTLLALRYVKNVAQLGAYIILGVQAPLKALALTVTGADEVIVRGEYSSAYDFHCPLMSLPLAFNGAIPADVPYVFATPEQAHTWQQKLQHLHGKRVGIVWSGNPDNKTDAMRSMPLEELLVVAQEGINLVCLKKDIRDDEKALLIAHNIPFFDDALTDFTETAALITNLDLVIAVDTSLAHLTGAMGKPVWVLLAEHADWRWLLNRSDSPWYPTAQLFRQTRLYDWASVTNSVKEALSRL